MDERRTLSILGMILGSLLGVLFVLNAIALSDTAASDAAGSDTAASNAPAIHAEQAAF
jgi:hypothetical protein